MTPFDELAGHFGRIVTGYASALDGRGTRAWIDGHTNAFDADGSWIACTRIAPALAAWVGRPGRPPLSVDVEGLLRAVLERGPVDWPVGAAGPVDQKTVESSVLAYAAWLARDTVLPQIDSAPLQAWLDYFGSGPPLGNNWSLFWVVNHAARKALGWPHDEGALTAALDLVDGLHRGSGWMTDGAEGRYDDYNWWVFGSHELMWAQMAGEAGSGGERRGRVLERVRRRLEDYPFFFGGDGSYPEYGRSLAYSFARLACPLLAWQLGCWPHSPGLLRAIVRRHIGRAFAVGQVDRSTGIVRQRLSAVGSPDVRERYIDTGHPYWSTMAFAALWQLADDDEFWTGEEEPLPVEQSDFQRVVEAPGWVLSGVQASGQVLRFSLGTSDGGAKYGKFVYGTHAPFDVGLVEGDAGPDAALCLADEDGNWAHPGGYQDALAGPGWLRARHVYALGDRAVPCETVVAVFGETWVTAHRLVVPDTGPDVVCVEGGAAFGYDAGAPPAKVVGAVRQDKAESAIAPVTGWDRALLPSGFRGNDRRNLRFAYSVTPTLEARLPADGSTVQLAAVARSTRHGAATPFPPKVSVVWAPHGRVSVRCGHAAVDVPPAPP